MLIDIAASSSSRIKVSARYNASQIEADVEQNPLELPQSGPARCVSNPFLKDFLLTTISPSSAPSLHGQGTVLD